MEKIKGGKMRDLSLVLPQVLIKRKSKHDELILYWNLALLVSIIILAVIYLANLNILSTKGYKIRQLEQQIKKLELEQKHLEIESTSLQSINRIESEASKLNFVPSTNVTYIKDSDFALK